MSQFPTRDEAANFTLSEIRTFFAQHQSTFTTLLNTLHTPDTTLHNELLHSWKTLENFTNCIPLPLLHAQFARSLSYEFRFHSITNKNYIDIIHPRINDEAPLTIDFNTHVLAHPVMRSHLLALLLNLVPSF
jgi:hypothetical protein